MTQKDQSILHLLCACVFMRLKQISLKNISAPVSVLSPKYSKTTNRLALIHLFRELQRVNELNPAESINILNH